MYLNPQRNEKFTDIIFRQKFSFTSSGVAYTVNILFEIDNFVLKNKSKK